MYLTQKNHIRSNKKLYDTLRILTGLSKNLYNVTLYTIRQHFFNNDSFLNYESAYHVVKENENYKLMPSQSAQQTMKIVDRGMRSFFSLLEKKKKGLYPEDVGLPHYLDKDGKFICVFSKDMFKVEGNKVKLSLGLGFNKEYGVRFLHFTIPDHVVGRKIKEVRIIPQFKGEWFEIEYVYLSEEITKPELDCDRYLSIDLGVNNFATCFSTDGTSFIVEGRGLKSFNRWWNKRKAELQSVYDKQKVKTGKKMFLLFKKRKNVVNEYMNKAVNYITKFALKNKIGNIVIGKLKNIKKGINHGRRNNQNFCNIPYGTFKRKLKGKCEVYGMEYSEVSERNTSKTCSECGDVYKPNRKFRGLYVCRKCNNVLNADVNGAINILKKVVRDSGSIVDSGCVKQPVRIRVSDFRASNLSRSPLL